MTITYDFDENGYDFEPEKKDLLRALAIVMIKDARNNREKPVESEIELVTKIIDINELVYDDNILEYYYDNLKDELLWDAREKYNNSINI